MEGKELVRFSPSSRDGGEAADIWSYVSTGAVQYADHGMHAHVLQVSSVHCLHHKITNLIEFLCEDRHLR